MDSCTNQTVIGDGNGAICGLPCWIGIAKNDTAAQYINNVFLAIVNGPCAIFAFLSNLAIIIAIIKNPSLQKPCTILLCGLAFTDCLTGVTAQPLFVAWRFFLQKAQQSCLLQVLIFDVYYSFSMLTVGLSFVNVLVISFDRHYALSRPMVYHSSATKLGAMKTVIVANLTWLLITILVQFVLPSLTGYIAIVFCGVLFLLVPTVNYIRMLFAIRRHNNQLGDAITSEQRTVILQREKKVAIKMWIVAILLLASLTPALFMKAIELRYPRVHSIVLPWSLTMTLLASSVFTLCIKQAFKKCIESVNQHVSLCISRHLVSSYTTSVVTAISSRGSSESEYVVQTKQRHFIILYVTKYSKIFEVYWPPCPAGVSTSLECERKALGTRLGELFAGERKTVRKKPVWRRYTRRSPL